MICSTVTEKLERELFTTSILFTFFQTVPGRLERDVTMAKHIGFSFANICSSAQANVYDCLLLYGNTSTGNIPLDHLTNFGSTLNGTA